MNLDGQPSDISGRPALRGERYVLFGKIAEGGMAGIYRAWDTQLKGWRAVKVLLPEFAQRRKLRQRFESEARAMAAIDHPNVVRVFDVVTDAALPYLVMEVADGGSLSDWIDEHGPMPPRLAIRALREVGLGLAAAHAVGVVHRDVKPQNVLLDRTGRCMVSDFGIARVEFLDHLTRTGTSMGTIGYMAPEQRNDAKVVDVRADVYACGALLYKLLTSVVLTDMFMIGHDEELIEPIPEPLRAAMVKACHHDRNDRYADVASFVTDVEAAVPLLPEDPAGTPPLANPVREDSLDTSSRVFTSIASVLVAMPGAHVPFDQTVPMEIGRAPQGTWSEDTASETRTRAPRTLGEGRTWTSVPPPPADPSTTPGSLRSALTPSGAPAPAATERAVVVVRKEGGASWLGGIVFGVVGVGALAAGALGFSWWTLRSSKVLELEARSAMYQAIEADRALVDLVNVRSDDPAAVADLLGRYSTFTTTTGEPARQEAADALVTMLLDQTAPLVVDGGVGHEAVQVRNLALAQEQWHRARASLAFARTHPPGSWMATFGF